MTEALEERGDLGLVPDVQGCARTAGWQLAQRCVDPVLSAGGDGDLGPLAPPLGRSPDPCPNCLR